ncbi:MAG: hypothetical protein M3467_00985 [Actinomycetota bacterium]|nr:hypothetical protein [Actinomycetota bacterium]
MDVRSPREASQLSTTMTMSWRTVLAGIAATAGIGYLVYAATIHEFPPAGFVYGTLLLLAALWVRRSGSRVAIGVAGLLHAFELFNTLFVYGNPAMVANPAAWQDFLVGVFFIVINAAGVVAAIGAWRTRPSR